MDTLADGRCPRRAVENAAAALYAAQDAVTDAAAQLRTRAGDLLDQAHRWSPAL